jgi:replicative DNA helicase
MRTAPEAESAALALCFKSAEAHRRITLELAAEHFTDERNREVYKAISRHQAPLDITLVAQSMSQNGALERIGGKAKLAALKFNAADETRLNEYITNLHAARAHRRLEETLEKASAYVTNSKDDLTIISQRVNDMLTDSIKDTSVTNDGSPLGDVLAGAFSRSLEAMASGNRLTGYRTGVNAIDDMIGGFEPGHVTTLMGEAGTGKTALALQASIGVSAHVPVGFISLEMTPEDLGQRIQASETRINYTSIRRGELDDEALTRIGEVSDDLAANHKLWIAPNTVETWAEVTAWITHMYYTQGVRVFIMDNILSLDYAGLDEYEHVTRVASGSQRLVKKLGIALVNLHHTNTADKPTLRATHNSKAVGRHSSNVLALWRENPEATEVLLMELKGRNSGRGERVLRFVPHQQRFVDVALP